MKIHLHVSSTINITRGITSIYKHTSLNGILTLDNILVTVQLTGIHQYIQSSCFTGEGSPTEGLSAIDG